MFTKQKTNVEHALNQLMDIYNDKKDSAESNCDSVSALGLHPSTACHVPRPVVPEFLPDRPRPHHPKAADES